MIEFVSEALLATLFPEGVGGAGALRVTEPVLVDDAFEASGIDFDGIRYLVFFADVMTYAVTTNSLSAKPPLHGMEHSSPLQTPGWSSFFAPRQMGRQCFTPANGRCPIPR